ncbi:MAG TPA: hypothetical protein DIT64_20490 [Verrucomicrobiales bacterium]|nr:hypothetical protein [Verrucomicrobiales bacterium]
MRAFHIQSLFTLAVGVLLVWWGAAVTTEDVGLAVPDWPLCFGRLNPEGWYKVPALLLEHGHRWIATFIGFQVLAMYFWQFAKCQPRFIEAAGIIITGVAYLFLVFRQALAPAGVILFLGLVWLVLNWIGQRWTLLRGLTTAALFLVIFQASLGGLRVLKMSDPYGISHGTTGQLFFCMLVLIALASSRVWCSGGLRMGWHDRKKARLLGSLLFGAVSMQLVIGAILRHTQRAHLAANDILTTKGMLLPPVDQADVFVLFLHKYWGFCVAGMVLFVAWPARRWFSAIPGLRVVPRLLLIMPLVQVALGVAVIWTGKSFWYTNFHVLNGLGLLVCAFLMMAGAWGARLIPEKETPAGSLEAAA